MSRFVTLSALFSSVGVLLYAIIDRRRGAAAAAVVGAVAGSTTSANRPDIVNLEAGVMSTGD